MGAGRSATARPGPLVAPVTIAVQGAAPLVEALAGYHRADRYGFTRRVTGRAAGWTTAPGRRSGGRAFRADVLATAGLDDRSSSHAYLQHAQELPADAATPRAG